MREEIEKQGGIKLIYIDPPFDVGANFSMDIEDSPGRRRALRSLPRATIVCPLRGQEPRPNNLSFNLGGLASWRLRLFVGPFAAFAMRRGNNQRTSTTSVSVRLLWNMASRSTMPSHSDFSSWKTSGKKPIGTT